MKQKRAPAAAEAAQPSRTGVTPDRIAHAALAIIDEKGLDGLSMRELGQRLGCAHTAIYWYFRSRDDLLKAVLDLVILKKEFATPATGAWDERAKTICRFMRNALLRHPALPLLLDRFSGRGMTPVIMVLCAALEEGGLTREEAISACRILMRIVVGFSTDQGLSNKVEGGKRRAEMLAQAQSDAEIDFLISYMRADADALFDAALELVVGQIRRAKTIF